MVTLFSISTLGPMKTLFSIFTSFPIFVSQEKKVEDGSFNVTPFDKNLFLIKL